MKTKQILFSGISIVSILMSGIYSPVKAGYSDSDAVYRGGICTEQIFLNGTGVIIDSKGNMNGVSVNVAPGKTPEEATASLKNKKVGVSSVGAVTKAGGAIVASPTANNPYHATLSGITAAKAESLFKPSVIPNPSQQCTK
jgi:hypothetical protein